MPEQFEAGVFGLTAEGWTLLKRRTFPDQVSATTWVRRNARSLASRRPAEKFRGSVVPLGSSLTLETVLADYEGMRKAGDPEFNETDATVFMVGDRITASYSTRQGQYLAFIYHYAKLNGQPPAEGDMQRHFKVSPPVVHDMILTLERKGLIRRIPGTARSIEVLLPKEQLPDLE